MVSCCDNLAATFRHRVIIQTSTQVSDGQGGFTEMWTDGGTVWASVETLKAYQRFQAMQLQTPATHKLVMRYRADVNSGIRLKFGVRLFWVQEVINVEMRNRYLILQVNERE